MLRWQGSDFDGNCSPTSYNQGRELDIYEYTSWEQITMTNENTLMGEKIRAALEAQGQRQTVAKNQIAERLTKMGAKEADFTVDLLHKY